jgi:hypothetical protein
MILLLLHFYFFIAPQVKIVPLPDVLQLLVFVAVMVTYLEPKPLLLIIFCTCFLITNY